MFNIGNIQVAGDVILSPMAGFSDSPYRRLTREFGSAFSFTEFVSADMISHYSKKSIDLFRFHPSERPIWFQIFGNSKHTLSEAVKIITDLEPDVIDLNMGCSTCKVSNRGSGAGLLKNLKYAGEIIEEMRRSTHLPVTAKIRIGWDHDSLNYKETVHILQESGIQMISVHGRTKSMGYSGKADWNIIAEVKSIAKVPILGNGDITDSVTAQEKIKFSNVDGVLIGRGALGNPWIFSGIRKTDLKFQEVRDVMKKHLHLMLDFYGENQGLVLFRKHTSKYLAEYSDISEQKKKLLTSKSISEYLNILDELNPDPSKIISSESEEPIGCDE